MDRDNWRHNLDLGSQKLTILIYQHSWGALGALNQSFSSRKGSRAVQWVGKQSSSVSTQLQDDSVKGLVLLL